jgi:L-ascorbate 6-phosphate lactonase
METLYTKLVNHKLTKGEVMICFLGQAGVLIKSFPDRYIIIDPYISNLCEEKIGIKFKRLIPQLIDPEELDSLKLEAYLLTHHHEDHLDTIGIQSLKDTGYPFYAPPVSMEMLYELGIAPSRSHSLFIGAVHHLSEQDKVYGVFADHGEYAPDAVGIIVEIDGKVIYHMGDTCLNREEFAKIQQRFKIDLLLVPINGRYGNMDAIDGAEAVTILQPRYAAPCHFWMLPGNSGGDPELFIDKVIETAPQSEVLLFAAGEIIHL